MDLQNFKYTTWQNIRSEVNSNQMILIDTRSEKEYSKGHIPSAVNLPLLNNEERHQVGLTYKQQGKSQAVALGLDIFASKAPAFIATYESITSSACYPSKNVAIYCWRGGLRSRLVGTFLAGLDAKILILKEGYQAYRTFVLQVINEQLIRHGFLVLNGLTGSGKTKIIEELASKGYGTLNFEHIANHRGSVFGDFSLRAPPNTPQNFENTLCNDYLDVCHHRTLIVELESNLGPIKIPSKLRKTLISSPMIFVSRDLTDRIHLIKAEYCKNWNNQKEQTFLQRLNQIKKRLSNKAFTDISQHLRCHNFTDIIKILLFEHYDKAYKKSLEKYEHQMINSFNLSNQRDHFIDYIQNKVL